MSTQPGDSVSSLYDRIIERSLTLVPRLVACIGEGRIPRRPQPARGASTGRATREEDFRLNFSLPARVLARWVAASPGQCFLDLRGGRVYLEDAQATARSRGLPPGALVSRGPHGCLLAAGEGALRISVLRTADGKEAPAAVVLQELGSLAEERGD